MAYSYLLSTYIYLLFIVLMIFALAIALPWALVTKVIGGEVRLSLQRPAQFFWKLFLKMSPLIGEIKVEGKENLNAVEPAIYVISHQSSIDFVLMGSMIKNFVTISNHPISDLAIFVKIPRNMGVHYMKKHDPNEAIRVFNILHEYAQKGANIFIFPEGTRNFSNELLPFQKGAFRLAYEQGIPVIPVVLHGTGSIVAKGSNVSKTLKKKEIKVTFFEPMKLNEDEKLRAFTSRVKEVMQTKVTENFNENS